MLDDFGSTRERATEIVSSYWYVPAVVTAILVLELATHKFVPSAMARKILYSVLVVAISLAMLYFAFGLKLPLMTADSILAE